MTFFHFFKCKLKRRSKGDIQNLDTAGRVYTVAMEIREWS